MHLTLRSAYPHLAQIQRHLPRCDLRMATICRCAGSMVIRVVAEVVQLAEREQVGFRVVGRVIVAS